MKNRKECVIEVDKKIFDIEEVLSQLTLEEKANLCSGRDFWCTQNVERLGIPKVMMCDGPNGLRKQLGEGDCLGINESIETVCYPTASAFASSFDRELLGQLGELLGQECQAQDVAMLLGPGVNLKRSPLCGRNFEYFSEDPYLAGQLAAAYIKGLQGQGVAACVKHFACNNQETKRLSGSSQVDERTLREIYLPAFEAAVKEGGTRSVMNAYNGVNGVFCAENKRLLTDILRDEWGFDGFVVTDWGAVKDRVNGILAGVDLEMPGASEGKTDKIILAVNEGRLSMDALNNAVRNVLSFVRQAVENRKPGQTFDMEAAKVRSEEFESQCAVLLKNNEDVLPLDVKAPVAFIGEFAEKPRYQGAGSSHINVAHVVSALECIDGKNVTYAKGYHADEETDDEKLLSEAVTLAKKADTAVIFAGLPEAYETEGCDRENMTMPENQNRLISAVAGAAKHTVVVLHGGAPVEMPWKDSVDAILCMYLGGDRVGQAAVELLYGEKNPCGKLAETWPCRLEDNPSYLNFPGEDGIVEYHEGIYIGYRYYDKKKMEVNFPFGHGLSYTSFAYTDLRCSKEKITESDTFTVTCRVKNTGSAYGQEIVQLYAGYPKSRVRRAVRELKGFEKIALQPGEEKEVTFTIGPRSFAYYETKIHDWFVESGDIEISVASSSRDIRLTQTVKMDSSMTIPLIYGRYSTIGEAMLSPKGRAIFGALLGAGASDSAADDAMGSGAERMKRQMMFDMPLHSLVSYGRITDDKLEKIIAALNG